LSETREGCAGGIKGVHLRRTQTAWRGTTELEESEP
jgi:hypothetical protein